VLGGLIQQIGIALAIGGFAVSVVTTLVRLLLIIGRRKLLASTIVIGFYARAVGTLGLMVMFTGMIATGSLPWPWLIAVFVLGAPALALLLVRPPLGVGDSKKPS
jgi:hypothetical protein